MHIQINNELKGNRGEVELHHLTITMLTSTIFLLEERSPWERIFRPEQCSLRVRTDEHVDEHGQEFLQVQQ